MSTNTYIRHLAQKLTHDAIISGAELTNSKGIDLSESDLKQLNTELRHILNRLADQMDFDPSFSKEQYIQAITNKEFLY